MTTIVFDGNTPFRAAWDSQVSSWNTSTTMPDHHTKVFTPRFAPHLLIGVAGALTISNQLETLSLNKVSTPPDLTNSDASAYVQHVVIPAMRALLCPNYAPSDACIEAHILLALFPNKSFAKVFSIGEDFSRLQNTDNFYTIGSGSNFAQSSHNLRPNLPPEDHVLYATQHDLFSSTPIHTFPGH